MSSWRRLICGPEAQPKEMFPLGISPSMKKKTQTNVDQHDDKKDETIVFYHVGRSSSVLFTSFTILSIKEQSSLEQISLFRKSSSLIFVDGLKAQVLQELVNEYVNFS